MVSDNAWLRAAAAMFRPLFPGEVRLFGLSELGTAKDWISGGRTGVA